MANTFHVEIVTPDRQVVRQEVEELVVPSWNGCLGILPMHAPLLATLRAGEVSFRSGGKTQYLAVSGGYVEVLPEKTTLLLETAEAPDEIDVDRATAARNEAEAKIAALSKRPIEGGVTDAEFRKEEAHLQRAVIRLQVARRGPSTDSHN